MHPRVWKRLSSVKAMRGGGGLKNLVNFQKKLCVRGGGKWGLVLIEWYYFMRKKQQTLLCQTPERKISPIQMKPLISPIENAIIEQQQKQQLKDPPSPLSFLDEDLQSIEILSSSQKPSLSSSFILDPLKQKQLTPIDKNIALACNEEVKCYRFYFQILSVEQSKSILF